MLIDCSKYKAFYSEKGIKVQQIYCLYFTLSAFNKQTTKIQDFC